MMAPFVMCFSVFHFSTDFFKSLNAWQFSLALQPVLLQRSHLHATIFQIDINDVFKSVCYRYKPCRRQNFYLGLTWQIEMFEAVGQGVLWMLIPILYHCLFTRGHVLLISAWAHQELLVYESSLPNIHCLRHFLYQYITKNKYKKYIIKTILLTNNIYCLFKLHSTHI